MARRNVRLPLGWNSHPRISHKAAPSCHSALVPLPLICLHVSLSAPTRGNHPFSPLSLYSRLCFSVPPCHFLSPWLTWSRQKLRTPFACKNRNRKSRRCIKSTTNGQMNQTGWNHFFGYFRKILDFFCFFVFFLEGNIMLNYT